MTELTGNDRKRIEQEIKSLMDKWGGFMPADQMLFKIAEYATIYEREQQEEEIKKLKYFQELDKARHKINAGIIDELEAECSELYKLMELKEEEQRNELKEWKEAYRSELRNKVIEEIDKYYQENVFTLPTTDAEQCILALKAAYQFILSLKTK